MSNLTGLELRDKRLAQRSLREKALKKVSALKIAESLRKRVFTIRKNGPSRIKGFIKQAKVSNSIAHFGKKIGDAYGLTRYRDRQAPCLFLGVYSNEDINAIISHIGKKIVYFGGSDILRFKRKEFSITRLTSCKNIAFVAESIFISKILRSMGVTHKFVPLSPGIINPERFKPVKKGPNVCIYSGITSPDIYKLPMCLSILKKIKGVNPIVITNPKRYRQLKNSKKKLIYPISKVRSYDKFQDLVDKCYSKCFIGLRLTYNDGNSATVNELGLLGIPVIHNGSQPNAINYKTTRDIERIIRREMKNIGTVNKDLSDKMKIFNKANPLWFKTSFYTFLNRT